MLGTFETHVQKDNDSFQRVILAVCRRISVVISICGSSMFMCAVCFWQAQVLAAQRPVPQVVAEMCGMSCWRLVSLKFMYWD